VRLGFRHRPATESRETHRDPQHPSKVGAVQQISLLDGDAILESLSRSGNEPAPSRNGPSIAWRNQFESGASLAPVDKLHAGALPARSALPAVGVIGSSYWNKKTILIKDAIISWKNKKTYLNLVRQAQAGTPCRIIELPASCKRSLCGMTSKARTRRKFCSERVALFKSKTDSHDCSSIHL